MKTIRNFYDRHYEMLMAIRDGLAIFGFVFFVYIALRIMEMNQNPIP